MWETGSGKGTRVPGGMSTFLGVTPGLLAVTDINRDKDMSGNGDKNVVFEKCGGQGLVRSMQKFGIPS